MPDRSTRSSVLPPAVHAALIFLMASAVITSFTLNPVLNQQLGFDAPRSAGDGDAHRQTAARQLTLEELTDNPYYVACPEPLLPMYDRVVRANAANDNDLGGASSPPPPPRKIPRTIHASMRSRCLSPDTHDALQKWKDALPYHSFYFHDDAAVDRLFDATFEEFPALNHWMRCVRFKGAMRINVWRILIVYRYGGLYTDVDMYPTDKFNESGPIEVDDEAFFLSDAWNRPSQWFFGMEPRHPIAYYSMYEIFYRLYTLDFVDRPNVVFVTGPDAIKFGYGRATLGWTVEDAPDVFAPGVHQCKWNKTVRKLHNKPYDYLKQLDMKEMVTWNETSTQKMTRKEKINLHHGMKHWVDEKNSKKVDFDGNCLDYSYALDHGLKVHNAGKYSKV